MTNEKTSIRFGTWLPATTSNHTASPTDLRPMRRFILLFIGLLLLLFTLQLIQPVNQHVVVPWTNLVAAVSSYVIQVVDPTVLAEGNTVLSRTAQFGISIEAGCNGVEAMIVLTAAMVAFPTSWRYKLIGLALGFLAVQGLNLVRIVSLFFIGQWNRVVFEWAHLYVWQALIMIDVLIVLLIWIRTLPPPEARDHGTPGTP